MQPFSVYACVVATCYPLLAVSAFAEKRLRRRAADSVASGRVPAMFDGWAAAVFLTGMTGMALVSVKGITTLVLIPFVAMTAGYTWSAIAQTLSLWRQGDLTLHLTVLPLTVGRPIQGHIDIAAPYSGEAQVELRVSCVRHYYDSKREFGHRSDTIWHHKLPGTPGPCPRGTRIRFSVDPPREVHESSQPKPGDATREYFTWSLEVTGRAAGLKIEESYCLPIERLDLLRLSSISDLDRVTT